MMEINEDYITTVNIGSPKKIVSWPGGGGGGGARL